MKNNSLSNYQNNTQQKRCLLDLESNSFIPWETKSRIICICIKNIPGEIKTFYDNNEEELLLQFFRYVNKKQYTQIVGFNIQFDARFIFSRCLKYRLWSNGFFKIPTYDLMQILKNVNSRYSMNPCGTLNDWSTFFFGKQKLFHNTEIPKLYDKGKISDIITYCKRDIELEAELLNRIEFVLSRKVVCNKVT